MDKQTAIESTVSGYATKVMGAGGTTALAGGLTANELMAFVGVVLAALGFLTNLWFQHRRDRREDLEQTERKEHRESQRQREEREHQRRMERMNTSPGDI